MICNLCIDNHGKELFINDYVVLVLKEKNIKGYVNTIRYYQNESFISVRNKKGKILIDNINSKYFSKRDILDSFEGLKKEKVIR